MLEISQNKYANNLMNSTPIRVDMPGEERISKNQSKELGSEDAATLEISEEGYRLSEATNYAKVKKSSKTDTYTKINNGKTMNIPSPGTSISVSLGTDKKSINAKITSTNAWSIEYSIQGCRNKYGSNAACTKRLNSALDKFSYNEGKQDLLKFNVTGLGKCYAGAMVEGFGNIGDVAEITLDDGTKFNFMILDTKNIHHKSSELAPGQCQNAYGHGYMLSNNTKVQLNICEFITSESKKGVSSAKNYPSGSFLDGRYVKKAKIIGHANI